MTKEKIRIAENLRDSALIKKIRKGSTRAYSQLFNFHYYKLCTNSFSLTHSRQDSEEIADDAFVAFSNALKAGKCHFINFGGWLRRTARNISVNRFRDKEPSMEDIEVVPNCIEEIFEENNITDENLDKYFEVADTLSERKNEIIRLWYEENK